MIDIIEIMVHWYAGRSRNELSVSLGVDRKTIRKYLAPAVAAGMVPGGPPVEEAEWRALVTGWFPGLADTRLRQVTWPHIEAHRDYIAEQLKANVTMATIHQRLRDEHGLACSAPSLRRWVRANLPEELLRSRVTVLKDTPPPGQEAQIDYGKLGMWPDPATGRKRAVWAFVMVLPASRYMFVRPVLSMDQHAWTQCHVEAFAFFGGTPARLVPDNLKTGVERPDLYDPKINRSYAELAAHYGCLVDPARAGKPKDKPQVERPMPYVRDSFWRGRQFTSLAQMQAEAVRWSAEVAGQRCCRPLEGAAPAVIFAAIEAERLQPLPMAPFVLATWSRGKVGPDIHVKVGQCLYSVPWKYIGKSVDARSTYSMVQFFLDGELIKTHVRKPRGKQTDLADYPPEKVAFFQRTPSWCRKKAAEIGPACAQLVAELMVDNALYQLRSAQGVIGLADKHNTGRLEAACAKAIAVGDPSYRTVKGILAAGTEASPVARPAGDGGAAAFLHGPGALFAGTAHSRPGGNVVPLPTSGSGDVVPAGTSTDPTSMSNGTAGQQGTAS